MIIDNLRKAGIQARDKKERLKFDSLEPFPGEWLHAVGEFTDANGDAKRVAICIGPEHGTVGPELLKEAAKAAVKGQGFDIRYVLGFAFDPHVEEESQNFGKLRVQTCRMNPDLSMGDELLKKTGAGNLFMVFGEPDITLLECGGSTPLSHAAEPLSFGGTQTLTKNQSGSAANQSGVEPPHSKGMAQLKEFVVEIRGVDVYDPTTGEIRSHSTDNIACWFIDTNHDGERFFVRHAYFTGADQPFDKLKRALKADIDEAAWSALYFNHQTAVPRATQGQDRREGHQPLRRRSIEGLPGEVPWRSFTR